MAKVGGRELALRVLAGLDEAFTVGGSAEKKFLGHNDVCVSKSERVSNERKFENTAAGARHRLIPVPTHPPLGHATRHFVSCHSSVI